MKMSFEDYAVLPVDLLTHIGDWRTACEITRDTFPEFPDPMTGKDDWSYWDKQLRTLDNIEKALEGTKEFRVVPKSPVKGTHIKRTHAAHMRGATKEQIKSRRETLYKRFHRYVDNTDMPGNQKVFLKQNIRSIMDELVAIEMFKHI